MPDPPPPPLKSHKKRNSADFAAGQKSYANAAGASSSASKEGATVEGVVVADQVEEEDKERGSKRMKRESVTESVKEDNGEDLLPAGEMPGTAELDAEIRSLLRKGTSLARLRAIAVLPTDLPPFEPICPLTTLQACRLTKKQCPFPHFDPIIRPWTDPSLGFCSYLNLCYGDPLFAKNPSLAGGNGGTKHCRYQHFRLVPPPANAPPMPTPPPLATLSPALRKWLNGHPSSTSSTAEGATGEEQDKDAAELEKQDEEAREKEGQWLNMDAREMSSEVLGKFDLILADPPWDIHMSLPYGTLSDDDCRSLAIPDLQPTWGLLAMWVTGRAMELARELFKLWGYRRVDEIVWVKVGQLGGLVKTGRTGHWLNHTCEHLLVALKLPPASEFPNPEADIPWDTDPRLDYLRRGVDGDVVVSEVRETSRKPEEFYGILERMVPRGRRLEVFGRKHNTRPGWLTIGNQLDDNHIVEQGLLSRLKQRHPQFPETSDFETDHGNMMSLKMLHSKATSTATPSPPRFSSPPRTRISKPYVKPPRLLAFESPVPSPTSSPSSIVRIPTSLPKNFQIDLLILERLIKRNQVQHRSALFFQKAEEVLKLGELVLGELDSLISTLEREKVARQREAGGVATAREWRQAAIVEVGKSKVDVTRLVTKLIPAVVDATERVNMVIHLHQSLPLATILLAIYARIWALSINIYTIAFPSFPPTSLNTVNSVDLSQLSEVSFGAHDQDSNNILRKAKAALSHRELQLEIGESQREEEGEGKELIDRLACEEMELLAGEEIGANVETVEDGASAGKEGISAPGSPAGRASKRMTGKKADVMDEIFGI